MKRIYLDHSATTPVDRRVVTLISEFMLEHYGNPSSIHSFGRKAEAALEEARGHIADTLHCLPDEIFFTCGGTESDNLALFGYARNHYGNDGQIRRTSDRGANVVFGNCG